MEAIPIHQLIREAHDPGTPRNRLVELIAHSNWKVRVAVASRPGLPLQLAQLLKDDRSLLVAGQIARQPRITKEMRQEFLNRQDTSLQLAVAENPACEAELLEEMAQDKTNYLCATIFKHPNLPKKLMEMVVFNSGLSHREILDPDRIEDAQRRSEVYWWRVAAGALAENPKLPADMIKPFVAAYSPAFVIRALATRDDFPIALMPEVVQLTRTTGRQLNDQEERERVPNRILQALHDLPSRQGWVIADPNSPLVQEVRQMPYRVTVGQCEVLAKRELDLALKLPRAGEQAQGVVGFFFPGQRDRWFFQQWWTGQEPKSGWLDLPSSFDGIGHFVRDGNVFGVHSFISFGDGRAHAWQTLMDEAKSIGSVQLPNLEISESPTAVEENLDCLLAFYCNFNVIGLYGKGKEIFGWKRLRTLQERDKPCRLEDTAVSDSLESFRVPYVLGVLRNLLAKGLVL